MTRMKRVGFLIAIVLLLYGSYSCKVEEDSGLKIWGTLPCDEAEAFPSDAMATYQISGAFDLEVSGWLGGASTGYATTLAVSNDLETNVNSDFLQGEGNALKLKRFEYRYKPVNKDRFQDLGVYRFPISHYLEPGGQLIAGINLLPSEIIEKLWTSYENSAYGNIYQYAFMRPSGNVACATDDDCQNRGINNGYSCDVNAGQCNNYCNQEKRCADGYTCDPLNGICRRDCSAPNDCSSYFCVDTEAGAQCREICDEDSSADCIPADQQDASMTVVPFSCINNRCDPDSDSLDPAEPETVLVEITAVAKNVEEKEIRSNKYFFTLQVCLGCLISYNPLHCSCVDSEQYALPDEIKDLTNRTCYTNWADQQPCESEFRNLQQDNFVYCSFLPKCFIDYCVPILEAQASAANAGN